MSLDIWLTDKRGVEVVEKNITNNLKSMWEEAGVYDALYSSNGKTASELVDVLENGLQQMIGDPQRFEKYNASNSWGLYKYAVPWLQELVDDFKKHPDATVESCI